MFFKIRPTDQKIRSLRDARKELSFSYADVGATRMTPPSGWRINHMRSLLGRGRVVHDKAVNALFSWELLTVGSLEVFATAPGVVPQADVAILSRHFGIWSVDFCRVIYVLNEEPENGGAMLRTGFGYGTLPGHAVRGEEIFSIERHLATQEVWYDIYSFSLPANPLLRLLSPFALAAQRRFARASLQKAARLATKPAE
jgi:uncharacterized protein (UPF0548 family)